MVKRGVKPGTVAATTVKKTEFDYNPSAHMKELQTQLGIGQFSVKLFRKAYGARDYTYLDIWPNVPVDNFSQIEEEIKRVHGGRDYMLEIFTSQHPEQLIYKFMIDADPIYHKSPQAQQQQSIPQMPQMPGMPPISPNPYFATTIPGQNPYQTPNPYQPPNPYQMPNPYGNPYASPYPFSPLMGGIPMSRGSDDKETKLEARLETLQAQMVEQNRQYAEEQRKHERELQEEKHKRERQEVEAKFEKRHEETMAMIRELKENKGKDSGPSIAEIQLKAQQDNNQNFLAFMKHQSDSDREWRKQQDEYRQRRQDRDDQYAQKDIERQKLFYERMDKMNDPSRSTQLLDAMSMNQMKMFSAMQDIAASNLFGEKETDSGPILNTIKAAFTEGRGLFEKWMENEKEKGIQVERIRRQGFSGGVPQTARPLPPHGQSQSQQQFPGPINEPKLPDRKEDVEQVESDSLIEIPKLKGKDEIISAAINHVVALVQKEAPAKVVAHVLFVHCDYMRFNGIIPEEMEGIFENPESVFGDLVEKMKTFYNYEPKQEYVEAIIEEFKRYISGEEEVDGAGDIDNTDEDDIDEDGGNGKGNRDDTIVNLEKNAFEQTGDKQETKEPPIEEPPKNQEQQEVKEPEPEPQPVKLPTEPDKKKRGRPPNKAR